MRDIKGTTFGNVVVIPAEDFDYLTTVLSDGNQGSLMEYDPRNGEEKPYPSHAEQFRKYHGKSAWLVNPWTGEARHAEDVGSDTFGQLIVPPI